jgi:hypothetical protein
MISATAGGASPAPLSVAGAAVAAARVTTPRTASNEPRTPRGDADTAPWQIDRHAPSASVRTNGRIAGTETALLAHILRRQVG